MQKSSYDKLIAQFYYMDRLRKNNTSGCDNSECYYFTLIAEHVCEDIKSGNLILTSEQISELKSMIDLVRISYIHFYGERLRKYKNFLSIVEEESKNVLSK